MFSNCTARVIWGSLILTLLSGMVETGKSQQSFQFINPENRWCILIDTTRPEKDELPMYRNALSELRKTLLQAGLKDDHIVFYSFLTDNPDFYPDSANITGVIHALRNPDANRLKVPGGENGSVKKRIRFSQGEAELQLYINAKGVANAEQTRSLLLPSDVESDTVETTEDRRLIAMQDIEKAMLECDVGHLPVERTLLAVNFLSVYSVTRGTGGNGQLCEIDLKRAGLRGHDDDDDDDEASDGPGNQSYQHLRILTKNESMTEKTAESFYEVLKEGLSGYADVSGNQDGILQASELVQYIESNSGTRRVETAQNGNDPYPICRTTKKIQIPPQLLQKVGDTFTLQEFQEERQSAYERAKKIKGTGVLK